MFRHRSYRCRPPHSSERDRCRRQSRCMTHRFAGCVIRLLGATLLAGCVTSSNNARVDSRHRSQRGNAAVRPHLFRRGAVAAKPIRVADDSRLLQRWIQNRSV